MTTRSQPALRRRLARSISLALGITVLLLAVMIVPPWFSAVVPASMVRKAAVALLLGAQPAYAVILATTLASSGLLGRALYRAKRRGEARPHCARFLVLSVACLFGLALAEGAAALRQAWVHRLPTLRDRSTRAHKGRHKGVTITVIGDSSAYGLPFERWLSTGRIVTWRLRQAIPNRRFRLEVLAEPGVHLERMHQKLAKLQRWPDVLIIYSGHNEFTYRYRWSRSVEHYGDERAFRPWRTLRRQAARLSPLCEMIQDAIEANGLGEPPPPEVTRQLVDVPACTPEEFDERLADFRRRLERIVAFCERVGTLPVLVIPPGNDAGFEPNRSVLPPETTRAERAAFARRFLAARAIERSDPGRALALYRALLVPYPGFAETHFRLARLLERAGQWEAARRHYVAARDLDALPMRCPSAFQNVYREVAARHDVILVDGPKVLQAASAHGILDDSLFLDAMHPNVKGHALLAQAILRRLHQRRAFGWPKGSPPPTIHPDDCARHFGLNAEGWKAACEWGATFFERTAHIRFDPSERLARRRCYRRAARQIAEGRPPSEVGLPGIGPDSRRTPFTTYQEGT